MTRRIFKILKKHFIFILFVIIYSTILAHKLVAYPTPFADWDESLYIQSGNEMFEQNYYLFPVWQEKPWLDKPPLVPFIYASTAKLFVGVEPEISTRLLSLSVSMLVLFFAYLLYRRVADDTIVPTLTVMITAFTPIFIQRAQIINLDIFLLLGWLGYLLFFRNFILGLLFLGIAVFSKSLIGFYPVFIMIFYIFYQFFQGKIKHEKFIKDFKKISIQAGILLLWFIAMLLLYKGVFWKQHIIESHFNRVTSSIEFHFGERTYYLDLVLEQFAFMFSAIIIGFFTIIMKYYKDTKKLLLALFFLHWFLFLNLTKTKIFWYLSPAIPQLAFFSIAPLLVLSHIKKLYWIAAVMFIGIVMYYWPSLNKNILEKTYASVNDPHYELSIAARPRCSYLNVLLDQSTRESFATLEKANLLITTTKWWGNHPSIIYYFGKNTTFFYTTNDFNSALAKSKINDCFILAESDLKQYSQDDTIANLKSSGSMHLFIKK